MNERLHAVLLAAGLGSRLGTAAPKCLAMLAGRSLFDWQRDALRAAGVDAITLALGDEIDVPVHAGERTVRVPRTPGAGPVDTLLRVLEGIDDDAAVLAVYADSLHRPDNLRAVAACGDDIAVAIDRAWLPLWRLRFGDAVLTDAESCRHDGRRLQAIGARAVTVEEIQGQFCGALRLGATGRRRVRAQARPGDDVTRLLARLLAAGEAVAVVEIDGGWCEVDTRDDLARYEAALASPPWSHDWRC